MQKKKLIIASIGAFCIFLIFPFVTSLKDTSGLARFKQVSIFYSPETQLLLEEEIREDGLSNPLVTRFYHNKLYKYAQTFLENYGQYYTLSFLGLSGGYPPRYVIPNTGVMYLVTIPFFLIGIYVIVLHRKREEFFLLAWLFIAPLSASLTFEDTPNMQRALLMVIPIQLITAYGFFYIYLAMKNMEKRVFVTILSFIFFLSITYFMHGYFVHQEIHRPWYRMTEMKEFVEVVSSVEKNFDKVVMTKDGTEPYIYFLFYNKINPLVYQKDSQLLDAKGDWQWQQYMFHAGDCINHRTIQASTTVLYVETGTCQKDPVKDYVREIRRPDGTIALRLYTISKPNLFPTAQ